MHRINLLAIIVMALFAPQGFAATAYTGATLIDGTHTGVIEDATVLVAGGRILAAGEDVDVPESAEVVDVSGKWIVPGLIDAHIHFMASGRMYTRPAFFDLTDKVPYEEEVAWIKTHIPQTLSAFLCSGVTGVLSLGGPSLEYDARALAESRPDAPSVFIGHGVIAHAPRFIAERTIPPWDGELTIKPVTSVAEGIAVVREAAANNANLVKTAVDSRGSTLFEFLHWFWNWRELQAAIVAEAARRGLKVTSHVHALEYARGLVEAGVASLQHIPADQPVDQAFIDLAREKGVIVAPTLALRKRTFIELFTKEINLLPIEEKCSVPGVVASWYEPLPSADAQAERYRLQGEMAATNARTLYEAGVPLAVATDSGMIGLAAGSSMHLELRALHETGIPADYLIHAATLNSARVADVDKDYGSVEAGKFADFLVLDADPLDDIGNLQSITWAVKHGVVFAQDVLLPES